MNKQISTGCRWLLIIFLTVSIPANTPEIVNAAQANPALVADLAPGTGHSYPALFLPAGSQAYFLTYRYGPQDLAGMAPHLYQTDGTAQGTQVIMPFQGSGVFAYDRPPDTTSSAWFGGWLFFSAETEEAGYAIWRSDGTAQGTDIIPGTAQAYTTYANRFQVFQNKLFISTTNGIFYLEEPLGSLQTLLQTTQPILPAKLVVMGERLYFRWNDALHGQEVWESDGTPAGTQFLLDVTPGATSSDPELVVVYQDFLYFVAHEANSESALWSYQAGQPATRLMAVRVASPDQLPAAPLENGLYFLSKDAANRTGLYRSNGSGVELVWQGLTSSSLFDMVGSLLVEGQPRLLFIDSEPVEGTSNEQQAWLYASDGSAAGTQLVFGPFAYLNCPAVMTGGKYVFSASDELHGAELWQTDGTPQGTGLLKDIYPGPQGSFAASFGPCGARVCFWANDGLHGLEPWGTDGTTAGTELLVDANGLPAGSEPSNVVVAGGAVYFIAAENFTYNLYRSVPGVAGAALLHSDIQPSGIMAVLQAVDSQLYYFNNDYNTGLTLWRIADKAAQPQQVKQISAGPTYSQVNFRAVMAGKLYFTLDAQLWVSDGSTAGTHMVSQLAAPIASLKALSTRLVFTTQTYNSTLRAYQTQVYSSNGVTALPTLLGTSNGAFSSSAKANQILYINLATASGYSLLATNGTSLSQVTAPTCLENASGGKFYRLTGLGDSLLFYHITADGTRMTLLKKPVGTVAVECVWGSELPAASAYQVQDAMGIFQNQVFFNAPGSNGEAQLWLSDGTNQGTRLLPGQQTGEVQGMQAIGSLVDSSWGPLYLRASTALTGSELWSWDGGTQPPTLVSDLARGPASSSPELMIFTNFWLYFVADDGQTGRELWVYDISQPVTAEPRTLFVDDSAMGANDGSSWANAFTDLQAALLVALPGNQIWVAAGTYYPSHDPLDRTRSFVLRKDVGIYGGFAGDETLLSQRNFNNHASILSGDIDHGQPTPTGHSYHVVFSNTSLNAGSVLDGFTIRDGSADGPLASDGSAVNRQGGGVYLKWNQAMLRNLVVRDNYGEQGGGMYIDGFVHLDNVLFMDNDAIYGGGLASGQWPVNSSSSQTQPILVNVTFTGNSADYGGAIANRSTGALYLYPDGDHPWPNLYHVTIKDNVARLAGSAIYATGSKQALANSIVWGGNPASLFAGDADSSFILLDSIIAGGCPAGAACTNVSGADPQLGAFGSAGGWPATFPLGPNSPAIDAGAAEYCKRIYFTGTFTYERPALIVDQRGAPRPAGSACDLGAHEFQAALSILSGDQQRTDPFSAFPNPLVVGATSAWGDNVEGLAVHYTQVNSGGEVFISDTTPTISGGQAAVSAEARSGGVFSINGSGPGLNLVTFSLYVNDTTVTLTASPNPASTGQPVTLTATVTGRLFGSPPAPAGTVTFKDGGTILGTLSLPEAELPGDPFAVVHFTTANLAPGTHALSAVFTPATSPSPSDQDWLPPYHDITSSPALTLTVGGQQIALAPGWNLVSFAVEPPSALVGNVLQSIFNRYDSVLSETGIYTTSLPVDANTLTELRAGQGYWLHITGDTGANLLAAGPPQAADTPLNLHPGWNWLGYLPGCSLPVGQALSSIAGQYQLVHSADGTYNPVDLLHSTLTTLQPGSGYLIYMNSAATLIYPACSGSRPAIASTEVLISPVTITPKFSVVYGEVLVNGQAAPAGARVEIITPRGELAGYFEIAQAGVLGYTHVYGAQGETGGFQPGEALAFRVNGLPVRVGEPVLWSNDQALHAVQLNANSQLLYLTLIKR